jgi:GntR family transcriptional regulator
LILCLIEDHWLYKAAKVSDNAGMSLQNPLSQQALGNSQSTATIALHPQGMSHLPIVGAVPSIPSAINLKHAQQAAKAASQTPQVAAFTPLYQQIKQLIISRLEQGEWRPGEAIPSEFDLASRFRVSQGTVRKAVDELAGENILVRKQGKGTFVATHTEVSTAFFRFLRIVRQDGVVETAFSRLIDMRRGRASAEVAKQLDIKTSDAVIIMHRVLEFNEQPVVYDEITLPAGLFRGISEEQYRQYKGSLYGFYESQFGLRMLRANEQVKAVAADPTTAEILRVGIGTPVLAVDRVAYTYGDKPVEHRRGLCTTRNHFYSNTLF